MAENRIEVLAGAAVLAAAVGFVIYAAQGKGYGGTAGTYELKASFRSVEGIAPGADVRLAGVTDGDLVRLESSAPARTADSYLTGTEMPARIWKLA